MTVRWAALSLASFSLAALSGCSYFTSRDSERSTAASGPPTAASASDPKLVAKYDALAGDILDTRRKEVELVRSILEDTYQDAGAALARAREATRGSNPAAARPALENLALLVGYIATEGDPSVARVRKRLIEGGHHFNPLTPLAGQPGGAHHAPEGQKPPATAGQTPQGVHHSAGPEGHHHGAPEAHHRSETGHHEGNAPLIGYDPGYVVVPRAAKKTLLDASRGIARISASPSPQALEEEWRKVESTCASLGIAGK